MTNEITDNLLKELDQILHAVWQTAKDEPVVNGRTTFTDEVVDTIELYLIKIKGL
jgi:hypothetical protein